MKMRTRLPTERQQQKAGQYIQCGRDEEKRPTVWRPRQENTATVPWKADPRENSRPTRYYN